MTSGAPDRDVLAAAVIAWWRSGNYSSVKLRHVTAAPAGSSDDYAIAHDFAFEPTAPECFQANVFITDTAHVGIGLERRDRIAARLGVGNPTILYGGDKIFAAGREPGALAAELLTRLLVAISLGEVTIAARVSPLGLAKTKAVVPPQLFRELAASGYLTPTLVDRHRFSARSFPWPWRVVEFNAWK